VFGYFAETESGYRQVLSHPLPWLVEILNGVEHANFFEQRATEYSKAASRGSWDGPDGFGPCSTHRRRSGITRHSSAVRTPLRTIRRRCRLD